MVVVNDIAGVGIPPAGEEAMSRGKATRQFTSALAIALGLVFGAAGESVAQGTPFCTSGQSPTFSLGFGALKSQLGDIMGAPVECEHANQQNGDALQQTTTGLSFYRKSTNTPTFTNGTDHWAMTLTGLVTWQGDSVDPPGLVGTDEAPAPLAAPSSQAGAVSIDTLLQGRFSQTVRRQDLALFLRIRAGDPVPSDMQQMPTYVGESGYPDVAIHKFRSGCILEASNFQHTYPPGTVVDAVVTIDQFNGSDFMAGPRLSDIVSH